MTEVKKTKSYCNLCLRKIPAKVLEKDGRIVIQKFCDQHGKIESDYMWKDIQDYHFFESMNQLNPSPKSVMLSLTSRCNLHCPICFANAGDSDKEELSLSEIRELNLSSFKMVKLTGGEPTLRDDLIQIVSFLKKKGKWVALYSNGINIADKDYTIKLKQSGLDEVVLQFDTFKDSRSQYMRGKKIVQQKLNAISNLDEQNIKIGLFVVLIHGSLGELLNFKKLLMDYDIRSLELTSQMGIGRYIKNKNVDTSHIFEAVEKYFSLKKESFYLTTKFLFNISRFFNIGCLNKCSLINMFFFHNERIIPISQIFNLNQINSDFDKVNEGNYSLFLFKIKTIIRELILNFFTNRNYRLFIKKALKNIRRYYFKNRALVNPFRVILVDGHMSIDNIDLNIVANCHKRIYSKKDGFKFTTCSYYIKKRDS